VKHIIGFHTERINTTDQRKFVARCRELLEQGYELHKASKRIDWPYFWRTRYKAKYRRHYVLENSKFAWFSQKEIDRIKTGVSKK
jgi:hypothetical protein